jgi:hypothetical protein
MLFHDRHFRHVYGRRFTFFCSAALFVVMADAPLQNLIFQKGPNPPQQFLVNGLEFVVEGAEPDLDVYYYTITRGNFRMLFSFFGIDTSAPCGPPSNLNFVHFIWVHSERLSFAKYAILLFPSSCRHPL